MMSFPVVGGGVGSVSKRILSQKLNIVSTSSVFDVNLCSFFCSHIYDKYFVRVIGMADVTTGGAMSIAITFDNGVNLSTYGQSLFSGTADWPFATEAEIQSHIVTGGIKKKVTGVMIRAGTTGSIAIREGKIEIIGSKY